MNKWSYLLLFLVLLPISAKAQWSFDEPVVEAYINDHRQVRSVLLARSTLELSNKLLHEYTQEAATDYKTLNVDLDKYTRAFDIIDMLYQSLRTGINAYHTYNSVSDYIYKYENILSEYNEKVLQRKRVELSDTILIGISYRCIERVAGDGKHLYQSVCSLLLYATGAAACSTSDLMLILTSINQSLDDIELQIRRAYFETWRYIQLRIGYWKASVYRNRTKEEIVTDAFSRWRQAGTDAWSGSDSKDGLIIGPTHRPSFDGWEEIEDDE
jgi:hypothetical protein